MHLDVEAAKLSVKEEITALQEWNDRLDTKLEKADSDVERVITWLNDRRKEKEAHAQEQKVHFEIGLDSKVRRTIEAVPLTPEGYNCTKSILTEKYGKESKIVNAYTREILELPSVPNSNQKKISEFSKKLTYWVQALETLKKLEQVNGAVMMTLDKLSSIHGDLVQTDSDWESWDFGKLSEAIRLWLRRNSVDTAARNEHEQEQSSQRNTRPTRIYHTHREDPRPHRCISLVAKITD